ncbi:Hypothetical protein PACV_289, partial [Pacmanvirus A23]|uniref:Hypothetical protein n=1 Tax=Pacmanvirus A23 TaxID=1932881 RepID=UPI000A091BA1
LSSGLKEKMPLDIDDDRMPGLVLACMKTWTARYPELTFDSISDVNIKNMKQAISYLFKQSHKCLNHRDTSVMGLSSYCKSKSLTDEESQKIFDDILMKFADTNYEYQIVLYATNYMHWGDKIYMSRNQNRDEIYVTTDEIIQEVLAKEKNRGYFGFN